MTKEYVEATGRYDEAVELIDRYKDIIEKVSKGFAHTPPKVFFTNFRESRRAVPSEMLGPKLNKFEQDHWPKVDQLQTAIETCYIERALLAALWEKMDPRARRGLKPPPA